jgi:putative FmdB family regulatory protein
VPVYEYECCECGKITEALQKFSDPPLSKCPHCQGSLRRLISLNSFHLKGSGWYVTDYAGKKPATDSSKAAKESTGKETPTGASDKAESKGESD